MNNSTLQITIKQRLNKLSSNDFDNIECWQIVEAFNKAQVEWVRRQLHGNNMYREGDEMSKRRIDDIGKLLEEELQEGKLTADEYEMTKNRYQKLKKVQSRVEKLLPLLERLN